MVPKINANDASSRIELVHVRGQKSIVRRRTRSPIYRAGIANVAIHHATDGNPLRYHADGQGRLSGL